MKRWSKQRIKEVCLSRLADSTRSAKYKSGCSDLIHYLDLSLLKTFDVKPLNLMTSGTRLY